MLVFNDATLHIAVVNVYTDHVREQNFKALAQFKQNREKITTHSSTFAFPGVQSLQGLGLFCSILDDYQGFEGINPEKGGQLR